MQERKLVCGVERMLTTVRLAAASVTLPAKVSCVYMSSTCHDYEGYRT